LPTWISEDGRGSVGAPLHRIRFLDSASKNFDPSVSDKIRLEKYFFTHYLKRQISASVVLMLLRHFYQPSVGRKQADA
jgi:hypothetical protein